MTNFQKLKLRPLIFLALAKLREPKDVSTTYFSSKEISEWIYDKRPNLKKGLREKKTEGKKKGSSIENELSSIKTNKKTKAEKDGANTFVLRENNKEIDRVEDIISVNDRHRPYTYSLGRKTVESELSATTVLLLSQQSVHFANSLPVRREEISVSVIYEKYKDDFELSSEDDVRKIVQDAVNGLYFTRNGERLQPTARVAEEIDFLEHLSAALPELVQKVERELRQTETVTDISKIASTKGKSKAN